MELTEIIMGVGVNHPLTQFMERVPDDELDDDFPGYELRLEELLIAIIHVAIDCSYVRVYEQQKMVYSAFVERDMGFNSRNDRYDLFSYYPGKWEEKIREMEKSLH